MKNEQIANKEIVQAKDFLDSRINVISFKTEQEKSFENFIKDRASAHKSTNKSRISTEKTDDLESVLDYSRDRDSIIGLKLKNTEGICIEEIKAEIVENAINILFEKINCKSISVFSFNKDGYLERIGLVGVSARGDIFHEWDYLEKYRLGDGLVGKAAFPAIDKSAPSRKFGELQFAANFLAYENLDKQTNQAFIDKFKTLGEAVAVPLNGRNKTYGVLRVIANSSGFETNDIERINAFAGYIATALSNFRRDVQSEIFKYLSQILLLAPYKTRLKEVKLVYQQIADLLVHNPETAFKACVLRTKGNDKKFHVQAISVWSDIDKVRDNRPITGKDNGLAAKVIKSGKWLFREKISRSDNIFEFKNKTWIRNNKLHAFGCFPMLSKDEVIGTISLYTGFNYDYYPDSVDFIQSIANLTASYVYRITQEKDEKLRQLQQQTSQRRKGVNSSQKFNNPVNHSFLRLITIFSLWLFCFFSMDIKEELGDFSANVLALLIGTYCITEAYILISFINKPRKKMKRFNYRKKALEIDDLS